MPMCCAKAELFQALAPKQLLHALQINIAPVLHEVGDTAVSVGSDLISISNTGQVTIGGGSGGGAASSGGATVAASG